MNLIEENNINVGKESQKTTRLDFKTWLFLYITHMERIEHPQVTNVVENKKRMFVRNSEKNEVYVFKNYDEYKNYFLMYLDDIDDELLDLAIFTRGSKGQIDAFKGICQHIIVKKKISEFYQSITKEQIDEIHAKGKLTPLEAVQIWESNNMCIESSCGVMEKGRCQFFEKNCHECLMKSASHQLEHQSIELKQTNSLDEEQYQVKRLII